MVLSTEERIFLIEHVFRANGEYTKAVKEKFAKKFPETALPHRNAVRALVNKFRETGIRSWCLPLRSTNDFNGTKSQCYFGSHEPESNKVNAPFISTSECIRWNCTCRREEGFKLISISCYLSTWVERHRLWKATPVLSLVQGKSEWGWHARQDFFFRWSVVSFVWICE